MTTTISACCKCASYQQTQVGIHAGLATKKCLANDYSHVAYNTDPQETDQQRWQYNDVYVSCQDSLPTNTLKE